MLDVSTDDQDPFSKKNAPVVAQKMVSLMQTTGVDAEVAAEMLGLDGGMIPRETVQRLVVNAVNTYHLPAAVVREFVRATRNKLLVENAYGKEGDKKIASEMLKQISADTEVGITAPPQPAVQINVKDVEFIVSKGSKIDEADLFRDE